MHGDGRRAVMLKDLLQPLGDLSDHALPAHALPIRHGIKKPSIERQHCRQRPALRAQQTAVGRMHWIAREGELPPLARYRAYPAANGALPTKRSDDSHWWAQLYAVTSGKRRSRL
jgi:hypothetical protein